MKPNLPKLKLEIELVPGAVWRASIYQYYRRTGNEDEWRKIKEELFVSEGRCCWVCGAKESRLEAHEFWEYDDHHFVQRLKAIHHLCRMCHKIKHIGFWCHTREGMQKLLQEGLTKNDLIAHFCTVNRCVPTDFAAHEALAFAIWRERSKHRWKQDLGQYDLSGSRSS